MGFVSFNIRANEFPAKEVRINQLHFFIIQHKHEDTHP